MIFNRAKRVNLSLICHVIYSNKEAFVLRQHAIFIVNVNIYFVQSLLCVKIRHPSNKINV